jgi:hypothetical protein
MTNPSSVLVRVANFVGVHANVIVAIITFVE